MIIIRNYFELVQIKLKSIIFQPWTRSRKWRIKRYVHTLRLLLSDYCDVTITTAQQLNHAVHKRLFLLSIYIICYLVKLFFKHFQALLSASLSGLQLIALIDNKWLTLEQWLTLIVFAATLSRGDSFLCIISFATTKEDLLNQAVEIIRGGHSKD